MRIPRALTFHRSNLLPSRRCYSSARTIQENDILFLRQQGEKAPRWHLTTPLRHDARVKLSYGASIQASDLIGRRLLDAVDDSSGRPVVLHEPTMASYIINSNASRYATPIYPHDATTIVSLLDLNLSRPGEEEHDYLPEDAPPPLEIFEAGTGMGSLTLHLSRALHAANPPITPALRNSLCQATYKREGFGLELSSEDEAAYDAYRASRRAVLHTLDRNPKHSRAAHKLIRQFRRALYFPAIDFHVGSIDDYLSSRLEHTDGQPFLSHAILDLPSAHEHASSVIKALHPNGRLIVFTPSISQIADFQAWALRTGQPIRHERAIELAVSTTADGTRDTGGGKEWDVKTVIPRSDPNGVPVQVMRPKVGERIAGGGFVHVMRRFPAEQMPPQKVYADEVAADETSEEAPEEVSAADDLPKSS